jgi:hypothetical protein
LASASTIGGARDAVVLDDTQKLGPLEARHRPRRPRQVTRRRACVTAHLEPMWQALWQCRAGTRFEFELLIADERRDRAFEDIHGLVLARGCEWDLRRLAARAP